MQNRVQYGPYSPQETERIINWLQVQKIKFEIVRDDQEAREALMNDGQNIINLADLRTQVYLAQIFYINLLNVTEDIKQSFESQFCLKGESFLDRQSVSKIDDNIKVAVDSLQHHQKKRQWAIILVVALIVQIFVGFYFVIYKN